MNNLKHRGSKRRFAIMKGDVKVEIFWHHGYKKLGAAVIHVPTGEWDLVFGSKKTLFEKIRQLAAWLAYPELQMISERLLGRKDRNRHLAAFWVDEIHIRRPLPGKDVTVLVKQPRAEPAVVQHAPLSPQVLAAISQFHTGNPHKP